MFPCLITNAHCAPPNGSAPPTLVDLQPSGRFLMEEFYYAGGLPAVLRRLGEANLIPNPNALTVNGKSLGENTKDAPIYGEDEVIRTLDNPIRADGGICVLRGNLAPLGAVLKPSAATPELMQHRGRAVVFENFDMYKARINDPELDVDASSILVMKNCGPKGYPGMAEALGTSLPHNAAIPAVDARRYVLAHMSGMRAVEMVREDLRLSKIPVSYTHLTLPTICSV